MKNIFVTGGGGFIGSNFIREILNKNYRIINLDLITYAASKKTLKEFQNNKNYIFIKGDIADLKKTKLIFSKYKPDCLINFAAETHVDRSIDSPSAFVNTNILGVFNLLKSTLNYLKIKNKNNKFKFIQVSTDEVYGSVSKGSSKENALLTPNSPYAASKTSADHLIFSFFKTYNFPSIITRSSNNYGPYQFPEKLIPLIILNALQEKKLPIYGHGKQIRNWLYVNDNAKAIHQIYLKGKVGNTYNIGGDDELTNNKLVLKICKILDLIVPRKNNKKYNSLITHVEDRPGHDKRYSLDSSKIKKEIGWKPVIDIESGLFKTINWYLKNKVWWEEIRKFKYKGQRLGKNKK